MGLCQAKKYPDHWWLACLVLMLSLSMSAWAADRRDSPSILLDAGMRDQLQDFTECISEDLSINSLWREVRDRTYYFFGSSYQARPDHLVPAWFEYFEKDAFNGLLKRIQNTHKSSVLSSRINQAKRNADQVEQVANRWIDIMRFIDMGGQKNPVCKDQAYILMDQVDQQRDLAFAWVDAINKTGDDALRWYRLGGSRTELNKAYKSYLGVRGDMYQLTR